MIEIIAWIAIAIFIVLALFQFLLGLGLPIGKLAWGGKFRILPLKLRMGSFISAGIFILAIFILLENSKIYILFNEPYFVKLFNWIFVGILGLSSIANMMSESRLEKIIMTPLAFILTVICLIIAIGN